MVDETAFQQLLSAAYVMQEHNRRLKQAPKLATQAPPPVPTQPPVSSPASTAPAAPIPFPAAPAHSSGPACKKCGAPRASDEFFCEKCGEPAERSGKATQKNWTSLWEMHHASESEPAVTGPGTATSASIGVVPQDTAAEEIDLFPVELEEIVGKFAEAETNESSEIGPSPPKSASHSLTLVPATADSAPESVPSPSAWTSAARARAWLDSLKAPQTGKEWFREEWKQHRGIISIALASAVLLAVIFQSTTQPQPNSGQPRELSPFEQMLVSLGLAEAPPPPALKAPGNPITKVWVDVHTALYYCPGADLYGKTPNGRYATQSEAQRDNFQPSTLKACD